MNDWLRRLFRYSDRCSVRYQVCCDCLRKIDGQGSAYVVDLAICLLGGGIGEIATYVFSRQQPHKI